MGYWYTAARDGTRQVALSGPHASKDEADGFVAEPWMRDRRIAEALDARAHFAHFSTIECVKPVSTVIENPKALRILNSKGFCFHVPKTPKWYVDADDKPLRLGRGADVTGYRGPFDTRREAMNYAGVA